MFKLKLIIFLIKSSFLLLGFPTIRVLGLRMTGMALATLKTNVKTKEELMPGLVRRYTLMVVVSTH